MKAWTIAANGLRRLSRDRSALFFTAALPVAIILIIGLATSGLGDGRIEVGLISGDDAPLAAGVSDAIRSSERFEVHSFATTDELAAAVRRGRVAAGIVVPAGFDSALRSGERTTVDVIADPVGGFAQAVTAVVTAIVSGHGALVQAASFASAREGGSFEDNLALAREVTDIVPAVAVSAETTGPADEDDLPAGFAYTSAANLVLFVFITSLAGAQALIESRRMRITERMFSTPTSARTIVAGELGARFLIALAQAVFIVAVGALAFGVEWGDPLAAVVLTLLFVLVGTAAGTLFGTLLTTPQQAATLAPVLGISMGMLSGCMWPREVMPVFMQRLGQLFPHSWAMDGWIDIIGRGQGIGGIVPQLAVLSAFVATLLPLATWRLRRAIAG